ncbi:MAG: chloride channel protein [Acidobacteria bacterium]|nr:chloride channel protein [Acidobacteriota bacterium]
MAARATRSLSARSRTLLVRFIGAASIGVVGGLLAALFLGSLNWATTTRTDLDWLVWLLPVGGLAVGLLYHHFGQPITGGTSLVLDAAHVPDGEVPARMAPMIWSGSVASHLVGASVGREGAAVQIVASVTDETARRFRIDRGSRVALLVCAVAAAFGGLFGVPAAGGLFAFEVQRESRRHVSVLPFAVASSVIAYFTARAVGIEHHHPFRTDALNLDWSHLWRYVAAGIFFGVVAAAFIALEHAVKNVFTRTVAWPPARPLIGGLCVLGLVALADSRLYLGVSFDLVDIALAGALGVAGVAFLWKMVFTAVSLGSGFVGGEMLPLFVMGALAGAQFARVTDASVPLFAALGLVAVFAAASKTPFACMVIGIEMFGWNGLPAYVIVCIVAVLAGGQRSIYPASPIANRDDSVA